MNIPHKPHNYVMVKALMGMVSFDPIPVGYITEKIYGEGSGPSTAFEQLGYESDFLLQNMGSAVYLILLVPVNQLIFWLIVRARNNCC